ncbi:MAG: sensor histidine kinase, partial [Pirellulales bacterium]|nr:sensor histidine kinase [Pirellulales bacterium]
MTENTIVSDVLSLGTDADLEAVLAAWNSATVQLEQTHEALREEVHRLTDELESKNRELARKNRLADLGRMASHVAHEVRNNLVPVNLYLSLLRRRICDDPENLSVLEKVQSGFGALETTVQDLLHFTSDREPRLTNFFLRDLVDDIHASLAPQISAQVIEVDTQVPEQLEVRADRDMLRRAALNLTLNALDAMPDGGTLMFSGKTEDDCVELEIADTGDGLPEENHSRVFEPFFTTK